MDFLKINEQFSVSGAINEEDMRQLKADGVNTLICTRLDGEEELQNTAIQNCELALKHGLKHFHVPVKSGQYNDSDIQAFADALGQEPERVHGYCRTGTRASHLWALSQPDVALATAEIETAGINVSAIKPA